MVKRHKKPDSPNPFGRLHRIAMEFLDCGSWHDYPMELAGEEWVYDDLEEWGLCFCKRTESGSWHMGLTLKGLAALEAARAQEEGRKR